MATVKSLNTLALLWVPLIAIVGCTSTGQAPDQLSSSSTSSAPKKDTGPTKSSQASSVPSKRYINSKFGYSLDVPTQLTDEFISADYSEARWSAPDRHAVLQILEGDSSQLSTPQDQLAQCKKQLLSGGGRVSQASLSGDSYTCVGVTGKLSYQEYGVVGKTRKVLIIWSYPASESLAWRYKADQTVKSFRPGPL